MSETLDFSTALGPLPKGLLKHCDQVRKVSLELALRFGVDPDKAELGARLHDVARAKRPEELLALARGFGLPVTDIEERFTLFLHGPVGAELLRCQFNVRDEDVLNGVRYHTVGRRGMSTLEKVLFLADKIEPGKDHRYPFLDVVRHHLETDLDLAMLTFIDNMLKQFLEQRSFIHPATVEARNDLIVKLGAAGSGERQGG